MTRSRGIAGAAALLTALTGLSQLLGLARDATIASVFGVGSDLDAYLVAQGVLNLVLALIAGAMARAMVPPLSRSAEAGDLDRSSRTVSTVLTATCVVLMAGSVVVLLLLDPVISVLAPGFDDSTADLAAALTRVVLVASVLVAGTNVLAAAAQAHGRFFFSGLEGIAFNIVMIVAAAVFGATQGVSALAVGFVVGSAARLLVQLPAVRAAGLRLRPRLALRDADVAAVLRLTPPLLVGSALANVNTLVDRAVGSAQDAGTISALSLGWRVVTLVDTLLIVTVAAAIFPAFSRLGASERRGELRRQVDRTLGLVLVLLTPAAVLLAVAAPAVVQAVFGRGEFGAEAGALTATAVAWYAAGAVGLGVRSLASRALLAVGDARTPVLVAVVAMVVNVVGDLTLGVAYGIPGLAASTTASLLLAAVASVALLARRHRAASGQVLRRAAGRMAAAAAVAVVAALGVARLLPEPTATLPALLSLAGQGAAVLVVTVLTLLLLRSPELRELRTVVRGLVGVRTTRR